MSDLGVSENSRVEHNSRDALLSADLNFGSGLTSETLNKIKEIDKTLVKASQNTIKISEFELTNLQNAIVKGLNPEGDQLIAQGVDDLKQGVIDLSRFQSNYVTVAEQFKKSPSAKSQEAVYESIKTLANAQERCENLLNIASGNIIMAGSDIMPEVKAMAEKRYQTLVKKRHEVIWGNNDLASGSFQNQGRESNIKQERIDTIVPSATVANSDKELVEVTGKVTKMSRKKVRIVEQISSTYGTKLQYMEKLKSDICSANKDYSIKYGGDMNGYVLEAESAYKAMSFMKDNLQIATKRLNNEPSKIHLKDVMSQVEMLNKSVEEYMKISNSSVLRMQQMYEKIPGQPAPDVQ